MDAFRTDLRRATGENNRGEQTLPGVVVVSGNRDEVTFHETFGLQSLDPDSPPMSKENTFWIASCTKLITAVAVLQLVEQGAVSLDEDITRIIHEWKDQQVLDGFDEAGKPIVRKMKGTMTLRHLLTHTAGMAYQYMNPIIPKYKRAMNLPDTSAGHFTLAERTVYPLLFDPGAGWEYSPGMDWAGVVVERLSSQRLEEYMSEHIFKPLGMKSTTFRINDRMDVKEKQIGLVTRETPDPTATENNKSIPGKLKPLTEYRSTGVFPYDAGGGGLHLPPSDYAKVLQALLKKDGTLLKPETVDLLFKPQLEPDVVKSLVSRVRRGQSPGLRAGFSTALLELEEGMNFDSAVNWAFGGLLAVKDVPGRRKKGSLAWGGLPNLFWWLDPTSNVYGMYATQILPFGDMPSAVMQAMFERAVYQELNQK
ncbi:beta-lactamase/transpeptidase-like protein [Dendrothele bispora CBS 962.96]|uniref:Beta-lactamase/transpeptidase-like protein n=1 Tax=Dendrothele bispora (strain CBS 962.96) TaxID=1314807 RepID=A0A4S8N048_DENBC|nr:beta-lactamase/transpeptidase-like protein [Dendrothele bispora CBS 962.96]